MAKLGPFWRKDNYSLVRGVPERLITHLSMWLVHVWLVLVLEEGAPGAGQVATVLVEGVGAMGVAGTLEVMDVEVGLVENLDGTFGCPLKVLLPLSLLSKLGVCLLILWWYPYLLKYNFWNLSMCLFFDFIVPVFFYFVDE